MENINKIFVPKQVIELQQQANDEVEAMGAAEKSGDIEAFRLHLKKFRTIMQLLEALAPLGPLLNPR